MQKMNIRPHDTPFARALNRVLFDGSFTAQEFAEVTGKSPRHIYNLRNGEANPDMKDAITLCRYCSERGEYRLSRCFLHDSLDLYTPECAVTDGRIDDDITRLVKDASACAHAHTEGADSNEMSRLMDQLRRTVDGIGSELTLATARRAS